MAGKTFFYFAYGSNLLRERLALKNPSATFQAVGKLSGYELVFVGQSARWKGGVANIRDREGGNVCGVVWKLDAQDLPSLDDQEGIYTPMEVDVVRDPARSPREKPYRCRTYQLRLPGQWAELNLPSPHYKDVIVRGARQNRLPEQYLNTLEALPDNGYQGELELYDAVIDLLAERGGKEEEEQEKKGKDGSSD